MLKTHDENAVKDEAILIATSDIAVEKVNCLNWLFDAHALNPPLVLRFLLYVCTPRKPHADVRKCHALTLISPKPKGRSVGWVWGWLHYIRLSWTDWALHSHPGHEAVGGARPAAGLQGGCGIFARRTVFGRPGQILLWRSFSFIHDDDVGSAAHQRAHKDGLGHRQASESRAVRTIMLSWMDKYNMQCVCARARARACWVKIERWLIHLLPWHLVFFLGVALCAISIMLACTNQLIQ